VTIRPEEHANADKLRFAAGAALRAIAAVHPVPELSSMVGTWTAYDTHNGDWRIQ